MEVRTMRVVFKNDGRPATINASDFNSDVHSLPEAAPDPETEAGRKTLLERAKDKLAKLEADVATATAEVEELTALVSADEPEEDADEDQEDEPLARLPGESAKAFKARVAAAAKE